MSIKLLIHLLVVISTLEVFAQPGSKVDETALLPEQKDGLARSGPKPLTPEQVERLASWKEGGQNMWELSGQTEGDMILLPQQRNGIIGDNYRWRNNVIPYELSPDFSKEQADFIDEAVKEFKTKSCVNVRRRLSTDVDYVYVTARNAGCYAALGRQGGNQTLNLQINGCLTRQIIIHEFLHAAGFKHQHSATYRDYYIGINWNNIEKGQEYNFYKCEQCTNYGIPYDYGSIMHYSEYAFSKNGLPTLRPLNPKWVGRVGCANETSFYDVWKLKSMYGCKKHFF